MRLPKTCTVYGYCKFFAPWKILIGDNSVIGDHRYLDGRSGMDIGNNVNISGYVHIYTLEYDISSHIFAGTVGTVLIRDWAHVATRATSLPDVSIEEGAVVTCGAVVTKDVEAWTMAGGVPAEFIKRRPVSAREFMNPRTVAQSVLMVKTAFITGITGHDEAYLSELPLAKRYHVYGLVLKFDTDGVERLSTRNTVDLVTDDLSDAHSIGGAIKESEPDEIRSLAALIFVPSSIRDFVMRIGVDVVGADRMMASTMEHEPEVEVLQRSLD